MKVPKIKRVPRKWSEKELTDDLKVSTEMFRAERIAEPKTYYEERVAYREPHVREIVEWLSGFIHGKDDTTCTSTILTDKDKFRALCYVASPFISRDDMKTLTGSTLVERDIQGNQEFCDSVRQIIKQTADDHRFPWVNRRVKPTQQEVDSAVMATLTLLVTQEAATNRRTVSKERQEQAVRDALEGARFRVDQNRAKINTIADGPRSGFYSGERNVAGSKADVVVTSIDGILVPIECKVSNSAVNSHKRLFHEAGNKTFLWSTEISECVPAVVVSGVFGIDNLLHAQNRGLAIFWQHRLTDLVDYLRPVAA